MKKYIKQRYERIKRYYEKIDRVSSLNELSFDSGLFRDLIIQVQQVFIKKKTQDNLIGFKQALKLYINTFKELVIRIKEGQVSIQLPSDHLLYIQARFGSQNSISQNVSAFIESRILRVREMLYCLKNYPFIYTNQKQQYIFGGFRYEYKDDIIVDKEARTFLQIDSLGEHFVFYSDDEKNDKTILDMLAFLSASPNFVEMDNRELNKKLHELYNTFNICSCMEIRNNKYFQCDLNAEIILTSLALKGKRLYQNIVEIPQIDCPEILELYHASLKQFEPLPRCIMLYRVIESAFDVYQNTFHPVKTEPKDVINYFWGEAIKARLNPVFCFKYRNGEKERVDLISVLKKEAKRVINEWNRHDYLHDKSVGDILYTHGRNDAAHGNGRYHARYDYGENYKHINNVNILLEIIARYVVETKNPGLKNMVIRK